VRDGVQHTESLLGPVDILVNSAGILYYTLMKNLHIKEWQQMVDVNVKGVLTCVGAVLGRMVERRQGHIVNISSDGGRKVDISAYLLTSNVIVSCGFKVPASVLHWCPVFKLCICFSNISDF
jgi:NADP-dependent 3-hydroxy acid dehydrogenase YdfG